MSTQKENAEHTDLLASSFVMRNESNYAIGQIISTMRALPGLRGLWPMSSVFEGGNAADISGQGRHLTRNGATVLYGCAGLAPYFNPWGGAFLARADEAGLDITGSDYSIPHGLTLGGWFYPEGVAGVQGLITKTDGASSAGSSYEIRLNGNLAECNVFSGANMYNIQSAAITANNWYFIAGRFRVSTALDIFINGVETSNAVGIPASINNTVAPFNIAAINSAIASFTGYTSLCFLSASALSDAIINNLYQQSRALFGV